MSEAEKRAWNIARKFLRELREATTSVTTFALEDVICGEFAKAARLQDERDHYKKQFLADIGDGERAHQEHIAYLRRQIADLRDAANCAWALLPAAQRVQMQATYPRLAELASDGYASAEDAQARAIREATEEVETDEL